MITIRDEKLEDRSAIGDLTASAFNDSEHGHNGEAELIDALRQSHSGLVSLVACWEQDIVGHILFSPVVIKTPQHEIHGMGLAPMSVQPNYQRKGIGSSLVTAGLDRLIAADCPFVVVLGDPGYYSRFGFELASHFNVSHGFDGIPQDVFFIRRLSKCTITWEVGSRAYYQPEFGVQHREM